MGRSAVPSFPRRGGCDHKKWPPSLLEQTGWFRGLAIHYFFATPRGALLQAITGAFGVRGEHLNGVEG